MTERPIKVYADTSVYDGVFDEEFAEASTAFMKNKSFDCIEMERKGAEAVYQRVASLSLEQQVEYWRKGSDLLRLQMQAKVNKSEPSSA